MQRDEFAAAIDQERAARNRLRLFYRRCSTNEHCGQAAEWFGV
jgi:hypothetical protein